MATKAEMCFDRSGMYFHFLSMKDKYKHSKEKREVMDEVLAFIASTMSARDVAWIEKKYAEGVKSKK